MAHPAINTNFLDYGVTSVLGITEIMQKNNPNILYMGSNQKTVPSPITQNNTLNGINKKYLVKMQYFTPIDYKTIFFDEVAIKELPYSNQPVKSSVYFNNKLINNSTDELDKCLFSTAGEYENNLKNGDDYVITNIELDLKPLNKKMGIYRFTKFKDDNISNIFIEEILAKPTIENFKEPESNKLIINSVEFSFLGNWNKENLNSLYIALKLLNPHEIDIIKGITFKIENSTKTNEGGRFSYGENTVYIQNSSLNINTNHKFGIYNYLTYIIIHELGHAIDFSRTEKNEKSSKRGKNSFIAISKSEGNMLSRYAKKNEMENFAEAFAIFKLDKEVLDIIRPLTSKYFQNL